MYASSNVCDLFVIVGNPFSCWGRQWGSSEEIYRDEVPNWVWVKGNYLTVYLSASFTSDTKAVNWHEVLLLGQISIYCFRHATAVSIQVVHKLWLSLQCIFHSLYPGNGERSRGCGDDPRRGLRLHRDLRLWLSVHHRENPQPHPSDAQTPSHPASRGNVLVAPQDGRLVPHLLPAECETAV